MIRHKAMFKVFFMITALCLGTPSDAGIPCIWCDYELLESFIDCCTQRMANNPNFKTCASSMEEMKTSLVQAAKVMEHSGPTKENVMKGAMAYEMASCLSGTHGNPNKKILFTKNMLNRCYQTLDIKPDEIYIKEVSEIMKDKLEEKENPSNVQQPKKEAQSNEIPQAAQNTSPSQYNSSPPQQVSADPNQGNNQWNGLYDKKQKPNFEPNPSQGSANAFAISSANAYSIPSGTPQQPPALPYNANPNQPYYPYNQKYNNQGNPSAYPIAYQNNPLNTANSNPGVSAASLSYASNEPQSQKGYNTPFASSFASAASQTPYTYPPQNYDYNPNSPAFNDAAASSASASATNYDGNNAASFSSGSYSSANSDQKSFPFNNSNKKRKQKLLIPINRPQSENIWPPPQNQQNKWDNNPNLNPVISKTPITQPELGKTSSVPQQTSPTATQNVAQENNWKSNNQKNVPSAKDDKDERYARAMKFSEILYIGLINNESFKKCFHPFTTKEQLKAMVSYMLYDSLSSCGYDEKTTQGLATDSISFMDGFPEASPTSSYAEAICQMVMVLFYRNNLIGNDPQGQAEDLKNYMSAALKKIESPSPPQYNDVKPAALPVPEQNLPYPTESIPYDNDYPKYDAADPQVKPYSFSNKRLDQPLDLQNKGSDYSLPQTLPIQKQKNQPNVYNVNDQPTDDKAISFDKSRNIKNKKKTDQSYADSDDKSVYKSDDNDPDVFPDQWQNQKQKNQPNTNDNNDNNDQSPDDESISYDKTIKNKSDKKDDQLYVNDKTVYRSYNDKKQPSKYKQSKKGNQPYLGSTGKDDDYSDDGSYPYGYFDDNGIYVYDDYYYDEDGDINPDYVLGNPEKEQSPRNDYNNNDKSKYKPKQQPDILIQKADSKTNKQGYNNPDTYNVPDDNSKKILISKTLEQQKDKSNPLYFPDYDKYGAQKPSKQPLPLPPIADDQKNSKLPDIGQENFSTAPIKPETLKNSDLALNPDKQTDLSTDAPVFQPDISDSSTNPDFNKAKNDESKARVEKLKKWTLDCMKDETFDYKIYSKLIAGLVEIIQQKHPDWGQQKSETTVLIETIFALTQLLLKSNVKEAKEINQQPQKIVEPVQLPPNSQWNNQNVLQKNQNPNYQSGQTNKNFQPEIQDKPAVGYSAPEQNIAYPSQNQEIQQNKWDSNPNPYPVVQNSFIPQPKPINENYVPQPNIPNSNQPSAQNYNSNVGNQEWRNNDRQISNDNANSRQYRQPPPIPGQVNTNQENEKWNDKIISIPQTVNSNAGAPNINNFKQPSDNQANLPGLQQKEGNNRSFFQNGNQGSFGYAQSRAVASSGQSESQVVTGVRDNWAPTPNYLNNPSSVKENQASAEPQANLSPKPNWFSLVNINQPFSEAQANWSPTSSGPNNPQNGNWEFIEKQGNWAPNGPSNPSLLQKGQNINQASFAEPQDNWFPISNVPSNPNFPQNGNQGNWAASQRNDFVNPGNPNIGGVNQAVNSQQRNPWNRLG